MDHHPTSAPVKEPFIKLCELGLIGFFHRDLKAHLFDASKKGGERIRPMLLGQTLVDQKIDVLFGGREVIGIENGQCLIEVKGNLLRRPLVLRLGGIVI